MQGQASPREGGNVRCENCGNEEAKETELGKICDDCYAVLLNPHLEVFEEGEEEEFKDDE